MPIEHVLNTRYLTNQILPVTLRVTPGGVRASGHNDLSPSLFNLLRRTNLSLKFFVSRLLAMQSPAAPTQPKLTHAQKSVAIAAVDSLPLCNLFIIQLSITKPFKVVTEKLERGGDRE